MEYNKIIAVTGLPGLYELLSSKSDGAIVRSLDDKTTRFVSSRIHNFSHLESIEVYTIRDNVNLVDILKAMESSSEKLPEDKDGSGLKSYFTKVYPDLDFDRVYSSDLKKMVKWFSVLKANDIEIKLSEAEEESNDEQPNDEQPAIEESQDEQPASEKSNTQPAPKKKAEKAEHPEKTEKESNDQQPKAVKASKEEPQAPAAEKPKAKKPATATAAAAPAAKTAAAAPAKKKAEKKEEPAEKPKKAAKKK